MNSITLYPDPATEARLRMIAEETGRQIEDLAEAAIAKMALAHFAHRDDDPAGALPHALFAGARRKLEAAL